MRRLTKPTINPRVVYLTCISKVRDPQLKTDFESIADTIEANALNYDQKGKAANWYLIDESDGVDGIISQDKMEAVYTNRMAKKGTPGRDVYDKLKALPIHATCPLCGHRTVEQLDHYLPKSKFPSLVVLPTNLIPSCEKCNKVKLADVPDSKESQILHPYYDDVSSYQWLFAKVVHTTPAALRFSISEVAEFDDKLNARIHYHFTSLELGTLYSTQVGAFLADIQHRLEDLHKKGGLREVKEYLKEEEFSRRRLHINSWQRAMFQALSNCDWFCDGGFK